MNNPSSISFTGLDSIPSISFEIDREYDLSVKIFSLRGGAAKYLTPGQAVDLLHWLNDHVEPDGRIR